MVEKNVTVQGGIDVWLQRRPIHPVKPACTRVLGTLRTAIGNVQLRGLASNSAQQFEIPYRFLTEFSRALKEAGDVVTTYPGKVTTS